ncbi:MAG: PEP/pyruvate-binding domain-containing protein [Deltaproteobacteria bacterium]
MSSESNVVQSFINRNNLNRDIYHDMMPFKVKEILLVSHLYDAYLIEGEGKFSENVLSDYANLNLTSLPRITGISFNEDIEPVLENRKIDLIVLMVGLDKDMPLKLSEKIKKRYPEIPLFILLNDKSYMDIFVHEQKKGVVDMVFMWNGESRIFFAMIEYLEDKMNAENDTLLASVRLILVVEDSPAFYSSYLSILYQIIFNQTNRIISEIWTDYGYKALKLRTRPKVLLATNYEEAISLFNKYKDYLFCMLTDIRFPKNNLLYDKAGFELICEVKARKKELPVIVMSSEKNAGGKVAGYEAVFIDKNSESQMANLNHHVMQSLNFGDFIFKDIEGTEIARASTINEFEGLLKKVEDATIMFHSAKDDFSKWLMARSEIQLAKVLFPKKSSEFATANEIREFLLDAINQYRDEKPHGNIVSIDNIHWDMEGNIVSLAPGSMGGKGRGLSFANSIIYQYNLEDYFPDLKLKIPKTAIIGISVFEEFIAKTGMDINAVPSYEEVKSIFLATELNLRLKVKLLKILGHFTKPLAVRSSGSFEDSISQPFSGIFETYIIPNNNDDKNIRLQHLIKAIKLVFASVFSERSVNYAKALNIKIGDEKMAVVIQELVGSEMDENYFPHISGVAQSYNFYPFAKMKAEDGFAVAAFGLGRYVVNGENAFRFSPKHPEIQALSVLDQVKFTQTYFYALNIVNQDFDLSQGTMSTLKKIDIEDLGQNPVLNHCASVYSMDENKLYVGVNKFGPVVINFASILKNEYIPLSQMLNFLLDFFEKSFGSPIEIEFAIDLQDPVTFYLLQIKPLIKAISDYSIDLSEINKDNIILFSEKMMGNGIIDTLSDVLVIKPGTFDKTKTEFIATELSMLNDKMNESGTQYILIGPGRWGTRDRFLGVPVTWPQINAARVIVETDLDGFPLDASYGSHFFHNLTTLNIAYFSVVSEDSSYLNYDLLLKGKIMEETEYFFHLKFDNQLNVKMDGKQRIAIIEA